MQKILIEAMHGLGDTVCVLPMIKVVRDSFPNAKITVLTKFSAGKDILLASKIEIDEIFVLDIYKDIINSKKKIFELRQRHYDVAVSCAITPVKKAKWFMHFIKPKRWYALQKTGKDFDSLNDKYHFVEANLLAVQDMCLIPANKQYPHLYAREEDLQNIKKRFQLECESKSIIGICVGEGDFSFKNRILRKGKVHTRGWGREHMLTLVQCLQNLPLEIYLLGGKAEMPIADFIISSLKSKARIFDFVGKTTIGESIAVASLCSCMVGVDTGMQHIAAAVGTPTVSIFGPTNPMTHGAYSENSIFITENEVCDRQYCYGTKEYIFCKNRVCLNSIKPIHVLDEIKKVVHIYG